MTTTHARTIIGEEHWEEFVAYIPKEPLYTYADGTVNYLVVDVINFTNLHNIKA